MKLNKLFLFIVFLNISSMKSIETLNDISIRFIEIFLIRSLLDSRWIDVFSKSKEVQSKNVKNSSAITRKLKNILETRKINDIYDYCFMALFFSSIAFYKNRNAHNIYAFCAMLLPYLSILKTIHITYRCIKFDLLDDLDVVEESAKYQTVNTDPIVQTT